MKPNTIGRQDDIHTRVILKIKSNHMAI